MKYQGVNNVSPSCNGVCVVSASTTPKKKEHASQSVNMINQIRLEEKTGCIIERRASIAYIHTTEKGNTGNDQMFFLHL